MPPRPNRLALSFETSVTADHLNQRLGRLPTLRNLTLNADSKLAPEDIVGALGNYPNLCDRTADPNHDDESSGGEEKQRGALFCV